jgi:RNA polymerase sigma-70 factor (ECF subfamily)
MAQKPSLRVVHPPEPAGAVVDFDAIFVRYEAYVAGVAARLLGRDDDEVEDVVQDVFWIASRRLCRIHSLDAARPWLVTVTVRVAGRRLRRRRLRRFFGGGVEVVDLPATGISPEQYSLLQRMYRVLDTLPSQDRIAWILRHVEGERLQEVALSCGCSLATAKRRIASAQVALAGVIDDE